MEEIKKRPCRGRKKKKTNVKGDAHHARKLLKEGLDISINGKVYRLYQVGKMPEILESLGFHRTLTTIRGWLHYGTIPDTPVRINRIGKDVRYFPREYIEKLAQIGVESGLGIGIPLNSTNFIARCSLELREILDKLMRGEL